MNFSERLKVLREELGYTQTTFAAFIGDKRTNIAQWETGKSKPAFDKLTKLLQLTGYSADWLLGLIPTKLNDDGNAEIQRITRESERLEVHVIRLEKQIVELESKLEEAKALNVQLEKSLVNNAPELKRQSLWDRSKEALDDLKAKPASKKAKVEMSKQKG